MSQLLPDHPNWTLPSILFDLTEAKYRETLRQSLTELGVKVTDYHGPVFTRDDRSTKGVLIWQLVLQHLTQFSGTVGIISSNTRDFGRSALPADLVADLEARNIPLGRVARFESLSQFLQSHALPRMKRFRKLVVAIENDEHSRFNLTQIFAEHTSTVADWLTDMVEDWTDVPGFFNTPSYDSPQLVNVSATGESSVMDAFQTEEGEVVLFVFYSVDTVVQCKYKDRDEYLQGRVTFDISVNVYLDPDSGEVELELGSDYRLQRWLEDWPVS
jgi:hypothetical protein